jgi:glycolate oxidase FAD binding subunit
MMVDIAIARPETTGEVCESLREAAEQRLSVHTFGHTPTTNDVRFEDTDVVLSMEHMDEIVAYEPDDLTVTVNSGAEINDVAAVLAQYNQRLSFEVSRAGGFGPPTIGGVIAASREGFLSSALGPIREQVLGMTVALSNGTTASVGGRVVKNVTGYDLTRVLCGSHGGLGVICDVTLRLHPIQEQVRTMILQRNTAHECWSDIQWLRDAPCTVSGLAVAAGNAVHGESDKQILAIRMEGRSSILEGAAAWIAARADDVASISFEEQALLWQGLTDYPKEQPFAARVYGLPSQIIEILRRADAHEDFGAIADIGGGSIILTSSETDPDKGIKALRLPAIAAEFNSPVEVESDLHEVRRRFERFPPPSLEIDLISKTKNAFDPDNVLRRGHWLVEGEAP